MLLCHITENGSSEGRRKLDLETSWGRGALLAFRMRSNGTSVFASNAPAQCDATMLRCVLGAQC